MIFKKIVSACIALCIMATLAGAMSGCDDLGAYENTEEYYNSLGDDDGNIFLIDREGVHDYSVEDYFYNKESREKFLVGENDVYTGVEYSDYVYMAIPFSSSIDMDTLALYIQSQNDVTVYINVFISDKIPTNWKAIEDNVINSEETGEETNEEINEETNEETVETGEETNEETSETEKAEKVYDDPDPETRIGEVTVHLKKGKWGSFVLDTFRVNGTTRKSIEIKDGQYILLQIRNNSGVRIFDEKKQLFVDPQTGSELQKAEITMTNLLIRALNIKNVEETQGGN